MISESKWLIDAVIVLQQLSHLEQTSKLRNGHRLFVTFLNAKAMNHNFSENEHNISLSEINYVLFLEKVSFPDCTKPYPF